MTTTVAVLAGLYQKLSQDSTFLDNLVNASTCKRSRDLIRDKRRIDMGNANGPNDLAQGQVEALQVMLLRWQGGYDALARANDVMGQSDRDAATQFWINDIQSYLANSSTSTATPTQGAPFVIDIKHQTLVNGRNVADMSDDQIFSIISDAENEVKRLNLIEAKPAKLQAKIDALQASIKDLGALVDARP